MRDGGERCAGATTTSVIPLESGIYASVRLRLAGHCSATTQLWQTGVGPGRHDEVMLRMDAGMTLWAGGLLPSPHFSWGEG